MYGSIENDDDEEEELENDDGFNADMEALRQACLYTGASLNDLNSPSTSAGAAAKEYGNSYGGVTKESDSDESEDDLELLRNVRSRFSIPVDWCEPLSLKPLCTLPPVSDDDDEEDDFETLRAIRRRFSAFDNREILSKRTENVSKRPELAHASIVASEIEKSDDSIVDRTRACEVSPQSEEAANSTNLTSDCMALQPSGSMELHQQDACEFPTLAMRDSSFPKSAQAFIDAIRRNRSCQKLLRSKLTQIEARIEENKKLKERIEILKKLQATCKKITGRALAQRKDPHIQLISARRTLDSKVNDKRVFAMRDGPVENSHVANYRKALTYYPLSLSRKKWTESEKENLAKGLTQQFQEMVVQFSVDQFSSEGSPGDTNNLDNILASIRDLEVTPEKIREFLPKVNWDQLASLYVTGHSGAECEARWLNCEDPLINHCPWTIREDKNLLFIVQEKGITNWFDIALSLGTNRTPFQCLARFQRSLNARILKQEWTKDEDAQLRAAVETFGECDWQSVASTLEGRTGTQCSNRWKKSLNPDRQRVGRWTLEENRRLKVAVKLFGPKNWRKIAQFVPGRTHVQCRERWCNVSDPSLNLEKWTGEEDLRLKVAVEEYGYCWAKVAKQLSGRTDNQCLRRWKVLFPHEVPLLHAANKMRKAALVSNFVDRESERPALGPNDFVPLPMIGSASEPKKTKPSSKLKRKSRGPESGNRKDATPGNAQKKIRSKRPSKGVQFACEAAPRITDGTEVENFGGNHPVATKETIRPCSGKSDHTEAVQDRVPSNFISTSSMITSGKVVDTRKNKKLPNPRPKENELVETDTNSQSLLLLPAESFKSGTTGDNVFQASDGNNNVSTKKGRARKQHSRQKMHTKSAEELSCSLSETERKRCTQLAESIDCSVPSTEGSELRLTNTKFIEKSSLDGITSNKECKVLKQYCRRKRHREPLGENQHVASVPCRQDILKSSEPSDKTVAKQVLRTMVEDNDTLASFLNHKSKKRRLGACQAHSPSCQKEESDLLSTGVDQLNYGNKMSSLIQDGEAQTCCNNGISENFLPCETHSHHSEYKQVTITGREEPCEVDMTTCLTAASQDQGRELVSSNQEGDLDISDMILASFLRNKLKKGRSLSHSKKGSELNVPEQFCNSSISENLSCKMHLSTSGNVPTIGGSDSELGGIARALGSVDVEGFPEAHDEDGVPPGFEKPVYRNSLCG